MNDSKRIIKLLEEQGKVLARIEKSLEGNKRMPKPPPSSKLPPSSKPTTVSGLIEELKKEGFFDVPRSLKDIKNELGRSNYHYAVTSLTNPLQRLVRQRALGRMLQNGMWAYVKR